MTFIRFGTICFFLDKQFGRNVHCSKLVNLKASQRISLASLLNKTYDPLLKMSVTKIAKTKYSPFSA